MRNPTRFEPAALYSAITALTVAVLPFLNLPDSTSAAVGAAVASILGLFIRASVTPSGKLS